ncbi:MAG: hypothetical protein EOO43_27055 [Flavobacterium sp.]|nr:MAG: hypothetical protein EOO43_27055 [Flavobacterium sp.]
MILFFHNYFELFSLLVAILSVAKLKNSFMAWFIPYLIIIITVELGANNYWFAVKGNNSHFYVIINGISYYFFSFIFYKLTSNNLFKKVILIAGIAFIGIMISVWLQPVTGPKYDIIVTSIALSSYACMYFYSTMQDDGKEDEYSYVSGLWIASGILIFYLGIIICFSLLNYIRENNLSVGGVRLYAFIPRCLSAILYSCFCISFVLWKAPMKSLSSQS